MRDAALRAKKDEYMVPLAQSFFATVHPNVVSLMAMGVGLLTAAAVIQERYWLGLLLWLLNRILDGLDGVIARVHDKQSDFGGYLDIVVDFVTYAAIPVGLAASQVDPHASSGMAQPLILSLIFLLCTYYVNAASWMYLAAVLEKRRARHEGRLTTIAMPAGIIGGTETIVFYGAFIIFPTHLVWLFSLMAGLIVITIGQRLVWAARHI